MPGIEIRDNYYNSTQYSTENEFSKFITVKKFEDKFEFRIRKDVLKECDRLFFNLPKSAFLSQENARMILGKGAKITEYNTDTEKAKIDEHFIFWLYKRFNHFLVSNL